MIWHYWLENVGIWPVETSSNYRIGKVLFWGPGSTSDDNKDWTHNYMKQPFTEKDKDQD